MAEMRLPDFITRALSFFHSTVTRLEKLEQKSTAPAEALCDACNGSGKCSKCKEPDSTCEDCAGTHECTECNAEGTGKAQVTALKATLVSLDALLATQTKLATDARTQVQTLTTDLAAEKRRANEVIAAQGLPTSSVPSLAAAAPGNPNGENA